MPSRRSFLAAVTTGGAALLGGCSLATEPVPLEFRVLNAGDVAAEFFTHITGPDGETLHEQTLDVPSNAGQRTKVVAEGSLRLPPSYRGARLNLYGEVTYEIDGETYRRENDVPNEVDCDTERVEFRIGRDESVSIADSSCR